MMRTLAGPPMILEGQPGRLGRFSVRRPAQVSKSTSAQADRLTTDRAKPEIHRVCGQTTTHFPQHTPAHRGNGWLCAARMDPVMQVIRTVAAWHTGSPALPAALDQCVISAREPDIPVSQNHYFGTNRANDWYRVDRVIRTYLKFQFRSCVSGGILPFVDTSPWYLLGLSPSCRTQMAS
ncbi:uncharacterized protein BJX67DRAFT_288129 [Aspergillus lucknowensis]|uniref:Uncharacterized protein n=1 Tax=Aspergillus lucknowensis TaxID=176173 RepID=A0ABR4LHF4_9EURO